MEDSQIHPQIKKLKNSPNTKCNSDSVNPFNQLPRETVTDILSRLPVKYLIQFTFASKTLVPLSDDTHLINLHLSRSNGCYLIVHSDYPLKNHLYFLELSDRRVGKFELPFGRSMPEFGIVGSCNGLLCLINSLFNESICIYNPFTRDYFELPKNLDSHDQIVSYGFGFDPNGKDYKVVKIVCYAFYRYGGGVVLGSKPMPEAKVYSKRSNVWTDKGVVGYRLEKWSSPGVFVGQRLHWVSQWGKYDGGRHKRVIVSYDLVDDVFHAIRSPCFGSTSGSMRRWVSCHLAELGGCLCASIPLPSGAGAFDVWVMKEYGVESSWTKEYSIGVYYPVSMVSHELERSHHIWRNMFGKKRVKVLCILESGEAVLEYGGGGLVVYNPCNKSFKELEYERMPRIYQTTVLVGSLVSTNLPNSANST